MFLHLGICLSAAASENLNKKQAVKFDYVDLKDGEAAIQYLVFPDALKIFVATKNDDKRPNICNAEVLIKTTIQNKIAQVTLKSVISTKP